MLDKVREILNEDCVVRLLLSPGYLEKLRECQARPENWPQPMVPYEVDRRLPRDSAVLVYKSGKTVLAYANGDLLTFPPSSAKSETPPAAE